MDQRQVGREFDLSMMLRLMPAGDAGAPQDTPVLQLIDEAVAAGVVVPVAHSVARYTFSHVLLRDTVYEDLSGDRRITLHRLVGQALEWLNAANVAPHATAIAHHLLLAATDGNIDGALIAARCAGDRALTCLAYEEAAAYFERADAALLLGPARPERRLALLLGLGEALDAANEITRARQAFGEAAMLARQLGDGVALAQAALGAGGLWARKITSSFADHSVPELLDEALSRTAALNPALNAVIRLMEGRARAAIEAGLPDGPLRGVPFLL